MTVTFKVVLNRIPELNSKARAMAGQAVRATARYIETTSKESMAGPKSGRLYNRGNKTHRASAPGEAPAIDTGYLVNSIQVQDQGDLKSVVYTNTEYAPHLEYGTIHFEERPFFRPAAKKAFPLFERLLSGLYK